MRDFTFYNETMQMMMMMKTKMRTEQKLGARDDKVENEDEQQDTL